MNPAQMSAVVAEMSPEELRDALWLIDVFERWNMPANEADAWRSRIVTQRRFLDLRNEPKRLILIAAL